MIGELKFQTLFRLGFVRSAQVGQNLARKFLFCISKNFSLSMKIFFFHGVHPKVAGENRGFEIHSKLVFTISAIWHVGVA